MAYFEMNDRLDVEVKYFQRGVSGRKQESRTVVGESPLIIDVIGAEPFTIMRTPGQDRELVVGFLFSEGLIDGVDDILILEDWVNQSNIYGKLLNFLCDILNYLID